MTVPGHLAELEQGLCLPLKARSHDVVIALFGDVLVEVAVGAPLQTVRPLRNKEEAHMTGFECCVYTWRS